MGALVLDRAPDLLGSQRDVDVDDAKFLQRIEDGVDDRRQ